MVELMHRLESILHGWLNDPTAVKVVFLILGLIILIIIVRFTQRTLERRINSIERVYPLKKLTAGIGYVLAFLLVISVFRDRLGGLTLAFGVAGAGVAFALQTVITSIAGWVAIMMGNFYRIGDRVLLGGVKGDVIDIGVFRTILMELGEWVNADAYNGRIVSVSNSFVFTEPVYNYSGDFPYLWDELVIPLKYGSDWKHARRMLGKIAEEVVGDYVPIARESWENMVKNYRIEDASVEPRVFMVANDNWIELTLRYVVEYKWRRTIRDRLFERILEEIDASGGKVALASSTFHLVETPVFDVRLHSAAGEAPLTMKNEMERDSMT
ncbi:MAG: mechanosensitive ion channel [Candidatus Eremiobacteraeota bacterium]|nr:mechanosensitive ion channel [Candidatus Eremiobacteraeota bacterium]